MTKTETRFVGPHLWAAMIGQDVIMAQTAITMTALSMLPPTPKSRTQMAALMRQLGLAITRGVRLRIILPAPTRLAPATFGNEATAQLFSAAGASVILIKSTRLLHAKTCLIDGEIAWVGSGNWTGAASDHNYEAWIRSTQPDVAAGLHQLYADLMEAAG